MRIVQLELYADEDFCDIDYEWIVDTVGEGANAYPYQQDDIDGVKIIYFSTDRLTSDQLDYLWQVGDHCLADHEYMDGSFDEIVNQLQQYVNSH